MKKTLLSAFAFVALCGLFASCGKEQVDAPLSSASGDARSVLPVTTGSLEQDSLALVELYKALDGDHWFTSSGWLSEMPIAQWAKVQVAPVDGKPRVVGLFLGANNLEGKLPKSLGRLTALQTLQLQYNRGLSGELIDEVYQLKQLRSLRIGFTSLTGKLSEQLGQLSLLDTLDMRTSPYDLSQWWDGDMSTAKDHRPNTATLTGELPKAIGLLKNLAILDLSHQKFSGSLPSEIGVLHKLDTLTLYGCNFSGELPNTLGNLKSLKYLSLGSNAFSGEIPASLGKLSALTELWMGHNEFVGSLPESLGELRELRQLNLEHNRLVGEIPSTYSKLSNLQTLYLNDNQLSGQIPADIGGGQQAKLLWVDLRNNNLEGLLPLRVKRTLTDTGQSVAEFQGFPDFGYTIFAVAGNRLTGSVAEAYLNYPKTLKLLTPQQAGYGFTNIR